MANPRSLRCGDRIKDENEEDQWAAINDLLFAIDPKVAVEKALHDIRITHQFCVADQAVILADDGAGGIGLSTRHFPKGFPPIALYQIRRRPNPGNRLYIDKPIAVWYARLVVPTDREVKWFDFSFHGGFTSTRQRTLERLLTEESGADIFHPWTRVEWVGTEATAEEIKALLDRQAAAIRSVVVEMKRRGCISVPAMPHLTVNVTVRDCRKDRHESLPEIAPVREIQIP